MLIFLDNHQPVPTADLLSVIVRYDLVPIPVSLEMTVRATDELRQQLSVNQKLLLNDGLSLTIVKSELVHNNAIKDGKRLGGLAIIAVLSGCEALLGVSAKAVIHQSVSFAEIYRSLGAMVKILDDIKVNQFVCLKGQMPTERIALALQKEAAVMSYDVNRRVMAVKRLQSLFEPSADIPKYDRSQVQWFVNPCADVRQNVHYLSVDGNGTDILGQVDERKCVDYIPRCDSRELNNLKRILMKRGVMLRSTDTKLMAGNLISIDDKSYVVLTSAFRFDTGALGGGSVMATKAWLADLVS